MILGEGRRLNKTIVISVTDIVRLSMFLAVFHVFAVFHPSFVKGHHSRDRKTFQTLCVGYVHRHELQILEQFGNNLEGHIMKMHINLSYQFTTLFSV